MENYLQTIYLLNNQNQNQNQNYLDISIKLNITDKITSKTKAILLCNPSNPTGYVYNEKEISTLCELAVEHDIFLIVDEVYREFIYSGNKHYSVLQYPDGSEHTVMIDSVSKRYSLCGARVGCIVSKNQMFIQNVLKFVNACFQSGPTSWFSKIQDLARDTRCQWNDFFQIIEFKSLVDKYYSKSTVCIGDR